MCFVFNAMALGVGPVCSAMDGAPSLAHAAHHGHGGSPGHPPTAVRCFVHLCCAHVSPFATARLISARFGATIETLSTQPAATFFAERPPYFFPFAHAPPDVII
jgi:hypothetical protein